MKRSSNYEINRIEELKNYRRIALNVKRIVRTFDPSSRVLVFGSVVKGEYDGGSDIDVLAITKKVALKYQIMARVYFNVKAPVELHVISDSEFEDWYSHFIDKFEEV